MEFDLREKRLEKEAAKRREAAKLKRDRESKLQQEQKEREEAQTALLFQRKIELERLERERFEAEQLELLKTGGIKFHLNDLIPYFISGEDDRILLPESALAVLNEQDAFSEGVLLFELQDKTRQKLTHCGVREFSAPAGKIGLTKKVIDSLTNTGDVNFIEKVHIKYVVLPKVTYVKFEPVGTQIFGVGPIKQCLEENLRVHATCTIGDVITVWYRGKQFPMAVVDLKPEAEGTLVDTDVEVEFYVPEVGREGEPANTSSSAGASIFDTATIPGNPSATALGDSQSFYRLSGSMETAAEVVDDGASPRKDHDTLPPEPGEREEGCIHIKIRTSEGQSYSRRFLRDDPVRHLFGFLSSMMEVRRSCLQLSTRNPERSLTFDSFRGEPTTFNDLAMEKRELFLVSVIPAV